MKLSWTIDKTDTFAVQKISRSAMCDKLASQAAIDMLGEIDKQIIDALKVDSFWWGGADEGELPIRGRERVENL